jgi:hypothetical protein
MQGYLNSKLQEAYRIFYLRGYIECIKLIVGNSFLKSINLKRGRERLFSYNFDSKTSTNYKEHKIQNFDGADNANLQSKYPWQLWQYRNISNYRNRCNQYLGLSTRFLQILLINHKNIRVFLPVVPTNSVNFET